jgi:hypothetical protein
MNLCTYLNPNNKLGKLIYTLNPLTSARMGYHYLAYCVQLLERPTHYNHLVWIHPHLRIATIGKSNPRLRETQYYKDNCSRWELSHTTNYMMPLQAIDHDMQLTKEEELNLKDLLNDTAIDVLNHGWYEIYCI